MTAPSSSTRRCAAPARPASPSRSPEDRELEQHGTANRVLHRDVGATLEQRAQIGEALLGAIARGQRLERIGRIGLDLEHDQPRLLGGRAIREPLAVHARELGRERADFTARRFVLAQLREREPELLRPFAVAAELPREHAQRAAHVAVARLCREHAQAGLPRRGRIAEVDVVEAHQLAIEIGAIGDRRGRARRAGPRARARDPRPACRPRGAAAASAPPRRDRRR